MKWGIVLVANCTCIDVPTDILLHGWPAEALLQDTAASLNGRVIGEMRSMPPMEYVRVKGNTDKQTVRWAGTRVRLFLKGHPYSLLELPGDGTNEAGNWDSG